MGLVDDQGVVVTEHPVLGQFTQQYAVGHHLDQRVVACLVGEAHGISDDAAEFGPGFLGDPLGNRPRSESARLSVTDLAGQSAPQLETDLG